MGDLAKLLDHIADGSVSAEDAVPLFLALLERGEEPSTDLTWKRMAGSEPDRTGIDTFGEVNAAWIDGRLSDEQYQVLREAAEGASVDDLGEEDGSISLAANFQDFGRRLAAYLRLMSNEDSLVIRVVVPEEPTDGAAPYVQFAGFGDGWLRGEVASDRYLATEYELSDLDEENLIDWGWEPPDEHNFFVHVPRSETHRLASMTLEALFEVFGVSDAQQLTSSNPDHNLLLGLGEYASADSMEAFLQPFAVPPPPDYGQSAEPALDGGSRTALRSDGGISRREVVADFWDDVLTRWLYGEDHLVPPLRDWCASYRGVGDGRVDLDHYPDPYVGDLRGTTYDPRLVVLGLNPGVGYDELQAQGGTWAERVRDVGYSHCFERSPAEDVESWVSLHGQPSRYWARLIKFAQRWLNDPAASVHDILNFELYPWHSNAVTGPMKPPADMIRQFVFDPIGEVNTPVVFAFGSPWLDTCADLGLPLVAAFGPGCNPSAVDQCPGWKLCFFELASGQIVAVSAQPGYAGPPGADRIRIVRHLLSSVLSERQRMRGSTKHRARRADIVIEAEEEGRDPNAVLEGAPLPVDLEEGFANVRPDSRLWALSSKVAERFDVTAGPNPPGYVGVRPLLNGAIAGYINKTFVDLQLAPDRAKYFAEAKGWKLQKSNSTTGTLRIPSSALGDPAVMDLAVDLFLEALEKSEAGPPFEGGHDPSQKALDAPVEVCPLHGIEKLGGRCDLCE